MKTLTPQFIAINACQTYQHNFHRNVTTAQVHKLAIKKRGSHNERKKKRIVLCYAVNWQRLL